MACGRTLWNGALKGVFTGSYLGEPARTTSPAIPAWSVAQSGVGSARSGVIGEMRDEGQPCCSTSAVVTDGKKDSGGMRSVCSLGTPLMAIGSICYR